MAFKSYEQVDVKIDTNGEGTFEAAFSKLNVIDHDNDVTLPGAFGQQKVQISGYNHGSWGKGADALPIGVGVIFERDGFGIVQGEFDMEDPDAVKTYKKLKYLKSKGRTTELSYALPETKSRMGQFEGKNVRFIEKVRVPEVSFVLMGAGIETDLLAIKGTMPITEHLETALATVKGLVTRLKDLGELRAVEGRHPSEATMKSAAKIKAELSILLSELEGEQEKHDLGYIEFMRYQKTIARS